MNLTANLGLSKLHHRDDFVPIEPYSHVAALPSKKSGKVAAKHDLAGQPTMVVYARFLAWAVEQARFPMSEQVVDRFHCSNATAHRWLNFLAEAYGVDRPKLRQCAKGPQR
ncbi:hypothetical protein [Lysobacter antibioticus]|uniref:Uncharacterized protein n=1 Tax=Lysobacter antibioticus TaxID=84531 RepID=A0A0S2F7G9_LYSAN|nr:hypothetical protein [Lysobacter antibioticus]ALN79487.1 hypothetical protein LA76x_1330 [Lysobacter antibioticus]